MRRWMKAATLLVTAAAILCIAAEGWCGGDKVSVRMDAHETVYAMSGVSIELLVLRGANEGTLKFISRSSEPIEQQVQSMGKLLARVLKDKNAAPTTLFMGTVETSFGSRREISERLIDIARDSPLWDAKQGKALDGNDNRAVKKMLTDAHAYKELVAMFAEHGLSIEVRSVEKVRVNDRGLPFDAMIWFSVAPAAPGTRS